MDLHLTDQVALVTGGASGIGAAIAEGLAREGCAVAIVDLKPPADPPAALLAFGRAARAYSADVRDFAQAERVVESVRRDFGRLDVLVCNAGITDDAVTWKMSESQWDRVLAVNLKGCFNYCRAASAVFKDQKRGRIVNIASINGLRGKFAQGNYAASKGGIISFSKTLARELGKFGVNVNVVAPGMVSTDMAGALSPEFVRAAIDETVLGRLASPHDCADLVAFLCSDRARHITGEVVQIDGGQYL
jgi:3-oxoacyl-[acyl-carrier protein] reductase